MTHSPGNTRLRQAIADAMHSLDLLHQQAETRSGPPAPGDLYVFQLKTVIAVEWAVVLTHPERADQVFVVPVDDAPLAGTPDVCLPVELVHRPLIARCGQGTWVPAAWLNPALRVGFLPADAHRLIRQGVANLARGELSDDPEREMVDDDPEYQDWLSLVEKARGDLEKDVAAAGTILSLAYFAERPPADLAPSTPVFAMSAKVEQGLVQGLAQALAQVDQGLRFQEIPDVASGKLILAADERGVKVLWVGAEEPPPLKGKGPYNRTRTARWKRLVADKPVYLAAPAFPWIDDQVALELGKDGRWRITVQK